MSLKHVEQYVFHSVTFLNTCYTSIFYKIINRNIIEELKAIKAMALRGEAGTENLNSRQITPGAS